MNPQSLSVLVIDDDVALLGMLKLMFERSHEMTVQTSPSADEALETLTRKTFAVIIVDYDMPGINGIDFLKILRKQGNTTPIILFTGRGGEHTAIEALNNGADFLLKKGEDPRYVFSNLTDMVKKAAGQHTTRKAPGKTPRMIAAMIQFSSEPCFAVDERDCIVAWNEAMEYLTGVTAGSVIGKSGGTCSEIFFGTRKKMLVNLVFETDDEIRRQKFRLISRVPDGPVVAVTRGSKKDGTDWILWMKALPVYDDEGDFVAVIGTVRDVTATFGDIIIHDPVIEAADELTNLALPETKQPSKGLFRKILGNPSGHYKEGVILYVKEQKFREAVRAFDEALAIDEKLPYVWNDRGTCLRELGDLSGALASVTRAAEMDPDNPEYLFNLGEILEMIGVMNMSNKYLDTAIQSFKRVVTLIPDNAAAWNHMGICFKEMGKTDESRFYFDRARDIGIWKKDIPIVRKRDAFLK